MIIRVSHKTLDTKYLSDAYHSYNRSKQRITRSSRNG